MQWKNFFVSSLHASGADGHIDAGNLRDLIERHDGSEAYHCVFDLEPRENFNNYDGMVSAVFGLAWFDFDSKDLQKSLDDVRSFVSYIEAPAFVTFTGSKGFHVGIPIGAFGLEPSQVLHKKLHAVASQLKKQFPTLDTSIYNANRKFRVLGSRHPKTNFYKCHVELSWDLSTILERARLRGKLSIPVLNSAPITKLVALTLEVNTNPESLSAEEFRRYRQPKGDAAFEKCLFLAHCKQNPSGISEPEWYAAASIVGRFENGRAQFHAISRGHPDYSKTKTDEKLDQALGASLPRTCASIGGLWNGCGNCELNGKIKSPIAIMEPEVIPTEATGFYDLIPSTGGVIKKVPNYGDLLRAFKRNHAYKTIADMRTVFVFNGTHYVDYTPIEIKNFSEKNFVPCPNDKIRNEFLHKVFANEVTRKTFFLNGTENRINFKNGVLDLETKELLPHSPDFGFRGVLPYQYDPLATCPTFDWWISDIMIGDQSLIDILQEFMGYIVSGSEYKYHKALWLAGSGRNGKSTFLSVLKKLIGTDNYATLSLRQIIQDKFASSSLDGKLANFSEETSPEELSDSGPFKNLTGDGEIEAQKKFGDAYRFRNRAKLLMTYNEVPLLKDLSPGMLSRPIVIPFKKDLTEESAQDKKLHGKLFNELPGILNFALRGWDRLEKNERFTTSEKSTIEMDEIRDASCTVAQWVKESLVFVEKDTVPHLKSKDLYFFYKQDVGQYHYAEQKFYKRLNAIPKMAERKKHTENGNVYISTVFRLKRSNITEY